MKKIMLTIILYAFFVHIGAQNPVKKFVESEMLKNGNISLLVKDLSTDSILYQYRPNALTIPASTMKTLTTATAIELLGGDFRIPTTLEYDGELKKNGVLKGNLYIYGNGDPTLGSQKIGDTLFLDKWVEAIKLAGIKKIKGNIVADNSKFDVHGVNQRWLWEDLGAYYGAGAYAISYKDNTYEMNLNSSKVGDIPQITAIKPNNTDVKFINQIKISSIKSDSIIIAGAPQSNERVLYGEMPANCEVKIWGDIPHPGILLANDLISKLKQNKIRVRKNPVEIFANSHNGRNTIYTHYSPQLREIIKAINVPSNNHYAEHLFRFMSLLQDTLASSSLSAKIIKNYWSSKLPSTDQLVVVDGSGLSPVNALSANFLVELLTYMNKSEHNTDFRNSLPIAGVSGTARTLLDNTRLQGKVRAKSGTMTRVRCYTGYIDDDKRKWVFAILVNNHYGKAKNVTDKIEEFLLEITK